MNKIHKILLISFIASSSLAVDSYNEGYSLGGSLKGYFTNNKDSTINAPLTSGAEMSSVDGSNKGNASLVCEEGKNAKYLSFSYTGSSDINIKVEMDKDLDGKIDHNWDFIGVSGICANGVVKCNSNTWNNCTYHQYILKGNTLSLKQVRKEEVSGCYCINNTCGSRSLNDRANVLNDIGASISSILTTQDQKVITKTFSSSGSLDYYAQDYSSCNTAYANPPSVSPSSDLESMAQEEILKESNNEYGVHNIFNDGTNNTHKLDENFKNELANNTEGIKATAKVDKNFNYSYTDTINSQSVNDSLQLKDIEKARYCEVMYEKIDTSAFDDGSHRGNSTNNTIMYQMEIRECTDNWSKCPVYAGEKIKHECGKINDMGEALAGLEAVNEASKDMVCSK
ncbi:hypothetical protein L8V92_02895 [Campylobacter lari]|uniref:hypothetical protein n=1 Tax=Campylobacter lari TaxID=201 RepID=UPI0021E6477B|nr:hypothetical protein [Campylobacter lari]MCV3413163.1 hypothetical protein [Campylobacter lari]MCV3418223.1 hypothetical protein [Campylobacter lari]MCV3421383.1 hypothetical protein [Campylobacter lari]MCW0239716.1 hypothetical protein [Campylobacter lari]